LPEDAPSLQLAGAVSAARGAGQPRAGYL